MSMQASFNQLLSMGAILSSLPGLDNIAKGANLRRQEYAVDKQTKQLDLERQEDPELFQRGTGPQIAQDLILQRERIHGEQFQNAPSQETLGKYEHSIFAADKVRAMRRMQQEGLGRVEQKRAFEEYAERIRRGPALSEAERAEALRLAGRTIE